MNEGTDRHSFVMGTGGIPEPPSLPQGQRRVSYGTGTEKLSNILAR